MMNPLDGDQLRAFVEVARERGFSRAAVRLGRTQSAVSQLVARLEREVEVRLFARRGRTTELTPAGSALLERAQRILDEMDRARDGLRALAGLREGRLVVGTSDTLACYLLPKVILAFRARYPGIDLRLDNRPSPATALRVLERAVDLGVVTLPLPPDLRAFGRPLAGRLRLEPLLRQEEVAIVGAKHPLARRKQVRVEDLLDDPWLLLDRTTGSRALLDGELARQGVSPLVAMEMSSVEVLKKLVELGLGVSFVPALSVEREVAQGTLSALRLRGMSGEREVGLVLPADSLSPAAAAFAAIAREALSAGSEAAAPV